MSTSSHYFLLRGLYPHRPTFSPFAAAPVLRCIKTNRHALLSHCLERTKTGFSASIPPRHRIGHWRDKLHEPRPTRPTLYPPHVTVSPEFQHEHLSPDIAPHHRHGNSNRRETDMLSNGRMSKTHCETYRDWITVDTEQDLRPHPSDQPHPKTWTTNPSPAALPVYPSGSHTQSPTGAPGRITAHPLSPSAMSHRDLDRSPSLCISGSTKGDPSNPVPETSRRNAKYRMFSRRIVAALCAIRH